MKKTLLIIAFASVGMAATAQELVTKKGFPILPEAGDWGLGIDAIPFLEYAGNLFHGSDASAAPTWSFMDGGRPLTISGFLVKDSNTSYRVKARLGFNNSKVDSMVQQTLNPDVQVTNSTSVGANAITLGAGIQKNRGKGRLRGIYGIEGLIGFDSYKTKYSYGNELSDLNQGTRDIEEKLGNTFTFTVRAFIGVEFFVGPKISLSGEFGVGAGIASTGNGELTTETWVPSTSTIKSTTVKTGKSSTLGIDNDNSGGAINLIFYF